LDNMIFLDEIEEIINKGSSVFILIPIMLGLDKKITSVYI